MPRAAVLAVAAFAAALAVVAGGTSVGGTTDPLETSTARRPDVASRPDPSLKPGELWYTGIGARFLRPRPGDQVTTTAEDALEAVRRSGAREGEPTVVLARYTDNTFPKGQHGAASGPRPTVRDRLVWVVTYQDVPVMAAVNARCPYVEVVDAVTLKSLGAFQQCAPPRYG